MNTLAVLSTLLMLLILYLNGKLTIILNLTSCITDKFNSLINELKTNKEEAGIIRDELNQNYYIRKTILEEIQSIIED